MMMLIWKNGFGSAYHYFCFDENPKKNNEVISIVIVRCCTNTITSTGVPLQFQKIPMKNVQVHKNGRM